MVVYIHTYVCTCMCISSVTLLCKCHAVGLLHLCMCCSGKRVWVDGTLRTSTVTGRTGQPLQSKNRGKVVRFTDHLDSSLPTIPVGSAERTDSDGISPGSEPNNGSPSTGASDISEATESKVEDTYLTRTARLTAAYKERQSRKCECKVAKAHSAPLPWRPVYPEKAQFKHYPGFSFSCLQSIDQDNLFTPKKQKTHRTATKVGTTSTCSLSRQQTKNSPGGNHSPSSDKGSQQCAAEDLNKTFLVGGGMPITGVGEGSTVTTSGVLPSEQGGPGSLSSGTPYTEDFEDESEPDVISDSDSGNQSEEDSPPVPLHSVDATSNQHAYMCPAINAVDRCGKNSGMTTSSVTAVDVTSGDMKDSLMLSKDATSDDMRRNVSSPAVTSAGSASMQRCVVYVCMFCMLPSLQTNFHCFVSFFSWLLTH